MSMLKLEHTFIDAFVRSNFLVQELKYLLYRCEHFQHKEHHTEAYPASLPTRPIQLELSSALEECVELLPVDEVSPGK